MPVPPPLPTELPAAAARAAGPVADAAERVPRLGALRPSYHRSDRAPLRAHDPTPEPLTPLKGDDHDQA